MAVDLIDHIFGFVPDEIGNVIFGDIQGQHDRDSVVAKVVEAVMRDTRALDQLLKAVADDVGANGDILAGIRVVFLIVYECFSDNRKHTDHTSSRRSLGRLFYELIVIIQDKSFFDRNRILGEINILPRKGGDLGAAHSATGGEEQRNLHFGILGGGYQELDLLLSGDGDRALGLLGQGRAQDQIGTVNLENGGQKAVDITDGFGGLIHGLLVDGDLDKLLGHLLHRELLDREQIVTADCLIGGYGGRAQDGAFGFDVLVHRAGHSKLGLSQRLVNAADSLVILKADDIQHELVIVMPREGLVMPLPCLVGVAVDGGVVGSAGKLGDLGDAGVAGFWGHGWSPFFRFYGHFVSVGKMVFFISPDTAPPGPCRGCGDSTCLL